MTKEPTTEDILLTENWRELFDCEDWRVDYLVHFGESDDAQKRERARVVLSGLRRRTARQELCKLAMQTERPWLDELLASTNFLPESKDELAVFLLSTKQWDRFQIEVLDNTAVFARLTQKTPLSARVLQSIKSSQELAAVKLLLKFALDGSLPPGILANAVNDGLASQKLPECKQEICQRWFASKDARLDSVLKSLDWLPLEPDELRISVALKCNKQLPEPFTVSQLAILCANIDNADPEISLRAAEALRSLDDVALQAEFYELYFVSVSPVLDALAATLPYRPKSNEDQVLLSLLTQNWDEFARLDSAGKITAQIYQSANSQLRERIAKCLRASAHSEWIVNISGAQDTLKLSQMTDLDWQLLQNALSASSSWSEIWKAIQLMPATAARRFIRRLLQVGWRPEQEDEKHRFERLSSLIKRLPFEQVTIWSDIEFFSSIDLGSKLLGHPDDGGLAALESRFAFSNDGSAFFFLARNGQFRMWNLPSMLAGQLTISSLPSLTNFACSPSDPLLACAGAGRDVFVCDLIEKRIVERTRGYETTFDYRISNLEFSSSGNYLSACMRRLEPRAERSSIANGMMWKTNSWKDPSSPIPPKSCISPDDNWLLYQSMGAFYLCPIDNRRSPVAFNDPLFRIRQSSFLPDSSAVCFTERTRLNIHEIPSLARRDSIFSANSSVMTINDLSRYRMLCLRDDYSWSFVDLPKGERNADGSLRSADGDSESAPSFVTRPFRNQMEEAGVRLASVVDLHGSASTHTIIQVLKDPGNQFIAIVHAGGHVSFWQASLSRYARKPAPLLNENDMVTLRNYRTNDALGESEQNWLQFILEHAGSFEHYAVEVTDLQDTRAVTLGGFDIEIA